MNHLQKKGKKTVASKILYDSFDIIKKLTKKDPLKVFEQAVKNARPSFRIWKTRRGRSVWYYPFRMKAYTSISLGLRWLITFTRKHKKKRKKTKRKKSYRTKIPMAVKLAREIISTAQNNSKTIRTKRALYSIVKQHYWRKRKTRKMIHEEKKKPRKIVGPLRKVTIYDGMVRSPKRRRRPKS